MLLCKFQDLPGGFAVAIALEIGRRKDNILIRQEQINVCVAPKSTGLLEGSARGIASAGALKQVTEPLTGANDTHPVAGAKTHNRRQCING